MFTKFFKKTNGGEPVPFTQIFTQRNRLYLVLPKQPDEAWRMLGAVRQWPGLFAQTHILAEEHDLPFFRTAVLPGAVDWSSATHGVQWLPGSLLVDCRPLHGLPHSGLAVVSLHGGNLELTPHPRSAMQLLRELARIAALPLDEGTPEYALPEQAVRKAAQTLQPVQAPHVLVHTGRRPNRRRHEELCRSLQQTLGAHVYVSGGPTFKTEIPGVYAVQPADLLELIALGRACDLVVLRDNHLGRLPGWVLPRYVELGRLSPDTLADARSRAEVLRGTGLDETGKRNA